MLMIALTSDNTYLKWIMSAGIVIVMSSMVYFYFMMPTSDSQYERGLNEFLIQTQNLSFSTSGKFYFQWPSFFVFTDIATRITGLQEANFEFLGFTIIAFLMCTSMYVYASKLFMKGGFLLAIVFFIGMYYYLDYQYCPFLMAFSLLFLLFVLDSRQNNPGLTLIMLILFVSMVFMHLFVPIFFILYLFIRYIISRDKHHGFLLLMYSAIYFLFATTYAQNGFFSNLLVISRLHTELTSEISLTIKSVYVPIDAIAQTFSTIVLVIIVALSCAGFFFLLVKRKLRNIDKAILFTGIVYTVPGVFIYLLSYRALPLVFLPICLGVPYIFRTRFKSFLISILLILLILFTFIPIHLAFYSEFVSYQTKEVYNADNFFIDHYGPSKNSSVLASFYTMDYLQNRAIGPPADITVDSGQIKEVDMIVYNLALQNELKGGNNTIETIIYEEKLNTVYDGGFSKILMKSYNST
jgi:hypothetical protein